MNHEQLRERGSDFIGLTNAESRELLTEHDTAVAELDFLRKENAKLRAENERLRALLTPCLPDTDAQTDAAYPKTVNDVLHLLSCYIADALPDDVELEDMTYANWELFARPVIERLISDRDERLKLAAFWEWSSERDKLQFESDMHTAEFPFD